jgi:glutamate synthase domain-containing protein 3
MSDYIKFSKEKYGSEDAHFDDAKYDEDFCIDPLTTMDQIVYDLRQKQKEFERKEKEKKASEKEARIAKERENLEAEIKAKMAQNYDSRNTDETN